MADEKQILVIDDQFDLGSDIGKILQSEADQFHIRSVPSGEEAWLELLRDHFDLVISKLRLPGMEGHELAKRAYRRHPDLPVILITGDRLERAKKKIGDVAVFRILQQPLVEDVVYKAIHEAIYGEVEPPPPPAAIVPEAKELPPIKLSDEVEKRLDILRADTGCLRLVVGAMDGRIAFTTKGSLGLNVNELTPIIARNLRGSAELASAMESDDPFSLHYQTSERFETYIASIGQDFFVALFFDVRARRSRFGMIWTTLQRGVGDLKNKMPILDIKPIEASVDVTAVVSNSAVTVETAASAQEPAPAKEAEPEPDIEPSWTPPASAANLAGSQSMSFEEAMKQGLLGGEIANNPMFARDESEDDGIDLFGDVDDSDGGDGLLDDLAAASEPAGERMTFEEAMKQGLLGGDAADNPIFAQDESEDDAIDLFGDMSDESADGDDEFATLFAEAGDSGSSSEDGGGISFADAMSQGLVDGGEIGESDGIDDGFELDLGEPDDDLEDDLAALEELAALGGGSAQTEESAKDTSAEEDAFWNAMVSGNTTESSLDGKSFEEAMQEGLAANDAIDGDEDNADFLAALEGGDDDGVDDLWSEESINKALSETVPGLSLDEAREQGLFDSDKKKKKK